MSIFDKPRIKLHPMDAAASRASMWDNGRDTSLKTIRVHAAKVAWRETPRHERKLIETAFENIRPRGLSIEAFVSALLVAKRAVETTKSNEARR